MSEYDDGAGLSVVGCPWSVAARQSADVAAAWSRHEELDVNRVAMNAHNRRRPVVAADDGRPTNAVASGSACGIINFGAIRENQLNMIAKLPKEQEAALHAAGAGELEVVDPETQRSYFVVDADVHRQAMEALRRQQDRDAIAQGIAEMEAGRGMPFDQARAETRARLGFPQAKS